jgi:hypothetical protein
MQSI